MLSEASPPLAGSPGGGPAQSRPLTGVSVVDLSALSPGPFCTMMLADFGAEVIRVEPPGGGRHLPLDPLGRGKRSVALNLKSDEGRAVLRRLVRAADVLVEGFRPGVAERLGAGYAALSQINPRLIYCSVTGWGQDGPLARTAGHDVNYLALSGALAHIGRPGTPPVPPLSRALVGPRRHGRHLQGLVTTT